MLACPSSGRMTQAVPWPAQGPNLYAGTKVPLRDKPCPLPHSFLGLLKRQAGFFLSLPPLFPPLYPSLNKFYTELCLLAGVFVFHLPWDPLKVPPCSAIIAPWTTGPVVPLLL